MKESLELAFQTVMGFSFLKDSVEFYCFILFGQIIQSVTNHKHGWEKITANIKIV